MIHGEFPDITSVLKRIVYEMVWNPECAVDYVKAPSIYSHDNLIKADSCEFEWDLQRVAMTKARWTRFLTQYIRKEELESWLQSIADQRKGIVSLLRSTGETKVTPSQYHPKEEGHRWGVCFLGVSFRQTPIPTLTLYSRTARIPTTAIMELTLISQLAKEIQKRYNINKQIQFTWFCSSITVPVWDILPYLTIGKEIESFIETKYPLAIMVKKRYQDIVNLQEVTKETVPYGRQRRITRRVREALADQLVPHCQVSKLSIWGGHS